MSDTLEPYLIELDKIRAAVGTANAALVEAIVRRNPEAFEEDSGEELSPRQALEELIAGRLTRPESAHQYGYVLKDLAGHLGEPIEPNWWCGVGWEALEVTGLADVLGRSGSPVELPPINGGFPTIGYLTRDEVAPTLDSLRDRFPADSEPDEEAYGLQDLVDEYEQWLQAAARSDKDLLFFYY